MDKKSVDAWWVRAERHLLGASIAYGAVLAAGLFAYGLWRESLVRQLAALPSGAVGGVCWGLLLRHRIVSAAADGERGE